MFCVCVLGNVIMFVTFCKKKLNVQYIQLVKIKKCVCAPVRDRFNCFLIPAESTLNTYCLINNHWIKGLLLFVYTQNENKTDFIYNNVIVLVYSHPGEISF